MSRHSTPMQHPGAAVSSRMQEDGLHITLSGRLDAPGTAAIWDEAVAPMRGTRHSQLTVNGSGIDYLDGAGVALLLKLKEEAVMSDTPVSITGLSKEHDQLICLTWNCELPRWSTKLKERRSFAEAVGRATEEVLTGIRDMVAFVGEATATIIYILTHPSQIRWKDVMLSCINVGVDSLFIITLIGFLMGLIMSFQSAVTLQQFGGEIYVPNMLGLVMFREMGPLVTAIMLAARSGSAFAAEIGTMKINEELDALTTMGLSPMRFLVVPRLLSAIAMVPLMTIFFNMASLVGGAVVMLSLGFPLVTFTSRVFAYTHFNDFFGGMFKAFVFAVLVAGVGCLRGIQTKDSASAVGLSTTSAVVSGIVCIAFADGIFAVAFYYLGW